MLTRFSSAIAIAVIVTGVTLATEVTPASAAGGPCGQGVVCGSSGRTIPSRPAPVRRGGGGGGGGNAAPMPCPGAVNCNAMGAGAPPPVQRIPTQQLAYNAKNGLILPPPHVHTSPEGKTYVELRTGLWVKRGDFARVTAAAPVPGQVVTAIATPKDITWNMGESTIACETAGSPNGTGCGYTYKRSSADQPGGKYTIAVTVTWNVYWTCRGACDANKGTFPEPTMSMTTNTTLAVGEVQTESRPG